MIEMSPRLGLEGVRSRYDPRYQRVYDDDRVPDNVHVVEALRRYDSALFVRFNRQDQRWELWRYRGEPIPDRLPPTFEERHRRACKIWALVEIDGSPRPVDWRLLKQIINADTFVNISMDPGKVADEMNRMDILANDKRKSQDERDALDWARDNRHQLRRFVGRHRLISTSR